mmetsp:Transcript_2391/g.6856  ORF Transcript_2391/g.6856 Transcript_2391/m.6856 type:complete len:154 (+) Transcript_2391:198-659(+)
MRLEMFEVQVLVGEAELISKLSFRHGIILLELASTAQVKNIIVEELDLHVLRPNAWKVYGNRELLVIFAHLIHWYIVAGWMVEMGQEVLAIGVVPKPIKQVLSWKVSKAREGRKDLPPQERMRKNVFTQGHLSFFNGSMFSLVDISCHKFMRT